MKRRTRGERHGLLLVDKPARMSSAQLVGVVSRGLGGVRAGHAGTLDPMATGLMLVCVGSGTKLATFLSGEDKEYDAEVLFGVTTDTLDADGTVLSRQDASGVTETAVQAALEGLSGPQAQVPPMYSALKQGGQPLYALARQGIEVERAARDITIHKVELQGFTAGAEPRARFHVGCSKGTYVRSLAAELGERLGVGAHLTALRRTRIGAFGLEEAVPGEGLFERLQQGDVPLIDQGEALRGWTRIAVGPEDARRVRDGKRLPVADLDPSAQIQTGQRLLVVERDALALVAVVEVEASGTLRSLRGFSS